MMVPRISWGLPKPWTTRTHWNSFGNNGGSTVQGKRKKERPLPGLVSRWKCLKGGEATGEWTTVAEFTVLVFWCACVYVCMCACCREGERGIRLQREKEEKRERERGKREFSLGRQKMVVKSDWVLVERKQFDWCGGKSGKGMKGRKIRVLIGGWLWKKGTQIHQSRGGLDFEFQILYVQFLMYKIWFLTVFPTLLICTVVYKIPVVNVL